MSNVEDIVHVHTLQTKVKSLEARVEDAENRNYNNLPFWACQRGEGANLPTFTKHLLKTLLLLAKFSRFFAIEMAH